jgi:hypothetical protein
MKNIRNCLLDPGNHTNNMWHGKQKESSQTDDISLPFYRNLFYDVLPRERCLEKKSNKKPDYVGFFLKQISVFVVEYMVSQHQKICVCPTIQYDIQPRKLKYRRQVIC